MANDKKFVVKNGLTAQNISFVDDITNANNTIDVSMLNTDTLSFSGNSGQLFSITDTLSGTIFSVNDISGIPSIEVDDDGTIRLAEFAGNVLIGTATDNGTDLLQVDGSVSATTFTGALSGNATTASSLQTARNIALTGAVTGNANFDGSGNISIATTATSDPTLTLTGDVTGTATFTNLGNATLTATVANDSHTHDGRYYTESEADSRFVNVTGDTMTGDLSFGSQIGTWITANVMSDAIGWNPNYGVYIGSNTLGYNSFIRGDGTFTDNAGTHKLFNDNYHPNADTLTTARTISLGGDLSGTASFDGSSNITITATVANDSHTHDGRYYTESEADSRFFNVAGDTVTGDAYFNGTTFWRVSAADAARQRADARDDATNFSRLHWYGQSDTGVTSNFRHAWYDGSNYINVTANASGRIDFTGSAATMYIGADRVFDDGYHPNADKLTTARTISLGGDLSGSASFDGSSNITITAAVADDSHNHTIANVDGLQTALDDKLNLSGGTMTGTLALNNADSLSFENGNHWITYNDGQGNFNIRVGHYANPSSVEEVTEAGYVFQDEWSQSGGWRQFNISSASLAIGDGITWRTQIEYDQNSAKLSYQGSEKLSTTSTGITVAGNITATRLIGSADTLTTARTISLGGDLSGSASFDGSSNITITAAVADDSHNHTIANVDGLQTALDGKLSTTGKAADSNLLDGIDSTAFLRSNVNDTFSGGSLSFGSTTRQMLNLYSTNYALGVQSSTLYYRSNSRFSWFRGGSHAAAQNDPGGGTVAMTLDSSSNLTVTGNVSAVDFNSTSDRNLKKDIVKIDNALDKVQSINGYLFTYKDTDQRSVGVIAQEVEEVLPEVVNGDEGHKTVSYGNMVGLLIEAIKEQQKEINELKSYINNNS